MDAKKKRVAIIGAGASGLAACKHALARGFRPVVFESGTSVGGVWNRTLASTRLQTPASAYRFSDFPWPAALADEQGLCFPRHDQVTEYMTAYARRFGVLERVRFGCRVLGASYVGPKEQEVAAWERWSGNGEAFGDGTGEWHLTVRHGDGDGESEGGTQTYRFDFLILCVGRYGVAKLPTFPDGRGPKVFRGRVLHSMEYSAMAHADAAELIRGKRVAVVGAGKSAVDIVAQCAEANGSKYPCTMVYRSAHWMLDPKLLITFTLPRWTELMVHKPGEGLALSLVATTLSPLRWLICKLAEVYYKRSIPMQENGMVPDSSFSQESLCWRIGILPKGFYDKVDDGSVELRRCRGSIGFCTDGLVLNHQDNGGERDAVVGADVVIFSTGFHIDRPLRDMFVSPGFAEMVAPDDGAAVLPLYRHCVHPRVPQMAVVGYAESGSSIYSYEMMAKWVAHLLDGAVRLPAVRDMESVVAEWAQWGRWARWACEGFLLKSCIASITTWYHDQLCRDMGHRPRRKAGLLAEWLQPYGPTDYADIQ